MAKPDLLPGQFVSPWFRNQSKCRGNRTWPSFCRMDD